MASNTRKQRKSLPFLKTEINLKFSLPSRNTFYNYEQLKITPPGKISEVKMATGYFKFLNHKLFDPTKWDISFVFKANLKHVVSMSFIQFQTGV